MLLTLSLQEAKRRGYKPLAGPYDLGHENRLLRNREHMRWHRVCTDMENCNAVAVEVDKGVEVWRHKSEMIDIKDDE